MMQRLTNAMFSPWTILVLLVVLWEVLSQTGTVSPKLLPPASQVFVVLYEELQRPQMHQAMMVTAYEVVVAFVIAMPMGILLGVFLAESKYWGEVFKPVFQFLFSIPKSIFLPMFILSIGIGVSQKIAYGVFSMIFIVVISTSVAVKSIKGSYVTVARCYGASRWQTFKHVYVPSMLPAMLETARLGMIFNFTGVILAEMYVSRLGVGNLIGAWGENYQLPKLLAGIVLVSVVAIIFNEAVRLVEKKYGHWRTE